MTAPSRTSETTASFPATSVTDTAGRKLSSEAQSPTYQMKKPRKRFENHIGSRANALAEINQMSGIFEDNARIADQFFNN